MDPAGSVTRPWPTIALAGLLSAAPGSRVANAHDPHDVSATADLPEEQAAAQRYVDHLRVFLETRIIPGIRRGILSTATSRPPALTVEVTDDPSPYNLGTKVDPNGSLNVRLSIGYVTMHDAALDAVALSGVLQRPQALRRYIMYQLQLARENHGLRVRGARPRHAMTFAEFVGLDPGIARAIFAQPEWQRSRDRVQADSLGWAVAYLLVQADPRLAGSSSLQTARDGVGVARLAAASGWFPVPPVASALGIAAIERSTAAAFDERALLCRAARLMQSGVAVLHTDTPWRSQLKRDVSVQNRVAEIRAQIASMRRDGSCAAGSADRVVTWRHTRISHRTR